VHAALLASLLALVIGPLVFERVRGAWTLSALDGFALVAVGGLVGVHILPQSFEVAGWWAAPVVLLGFLGPGLLCGSRLLSGATGNRITLPLALLGIALHALLDGVALGGSGAGDGLDALAWAVVLHRISDGLGIWWLARPAYGKRVALLLLATLAGFSVLGYALDAQLEARVSQSWFALLQALIAGSLLHVILRHPPNAPREGQAATTRLASGLGGLAGLALVLLLEGFHVEGEAHDSVFLTLALQSAPALLASYAAVALLHAWQIDLTRVLGGGTKLSQAVRGTLVGLPMPICSCGVIPLYRNLVLQGVPVAAALAFLVSGPELSVTALFLSTSLLGVELTLARAAAAAALALVVGLLIGARAPVTERVRPVVSLGGKPTLGARLRSGAAYGLGDMVDATAAWILVGLGLAALLEPRLAPETLAGFPAWAQVPLFALIGMPIYVCASGSTPLAAVLIAKGVSPGAAVAFLLTGPATNVTTFGMLSRLHSRRTALLFAGLTALTTTALGWATDLWLLGRTAHVAEHLHEHGGGWLELACALGLLALFTVSILRKGTRHFVGQVISPHGSAHEHDGHDHGEHGHEHAAAPAHSCCSHGATAPTPERPFVGKLGP
jgi:hypothetical protein